MISNEEALNRDPSSFPGGTDITSIVDSLYSCLYQFAVGLTKSEHDALDLVQQTFLTFGQRLDQIRDFSKIKSWLFTTLRRHFLLKIRRHKKHPEVQFLPNAHDFRAEDPEVWSKDPDVWRYLDARNVRDALLQVNEKYRVALELFYLNDLSYREIADALGIPIGTVMSRLCRGKAQLKSILRQSKFTSLDATPAKQTFFEEALRRRQAHAGRWSRNNRHFSF
jgi:RNA polymerase sigma-70 factor (ECF subfamily)